MMTSSIQHEECPKFVLSFILLAKLKYSPLGTLCCLTYSVHGILLFDTMFYSVLVIGLASSSVLFVNQEFGGK